MAQARQVLEKHRLWIQRQRETVLRRHATLLERAAAAEDVVHGHRLTLRPSELAACRTEIQPGQVLVSYPSHADHFTDPAILKIIQRGLLEACRRAARDILPGRTKELAGIHGFRIGTIRVKSMTSRWGSCSPEGSLNLNIQLMRLDAELRDYVILHELVHTRVRNHGRLYWDELSRVLPTARSLDRRLRAVRIWD